MAGPPMPRLHFEDFTPGATATYGGITVETDDIVRFAREYDPQPFHLDDEAAKRTFVGRLIASGWHTCALTMRMIADGFLLDAAAMGAPGIEEVRWLRPVAPGDVLRVRSTVLEARRSRSRPDRGLVRFRFEVLNQADDIVMIQTNWILFGCREAASGAPDPSRRPPSRNPAAASAATPEGRAEPSAAFDDFAPGARCEFGAHSFTAAEIIDFARRYDPQPFHVDPEAARRSSFGALAASGWQTAAVWMRLMLQHRGRVQAERGSAVELGPSPGFTDMAWLKPVYAGDAIAYASTLIETRPSASRPGWSLACHRNSGVNQTGEEVFRFRSCVFWRR
jgi:acyl dehydratase